MPVVLLWGLPVLLVIGGVAYVFVKQPRNGGLGLTRSEPFVFEERHGRPKALRFFGLLFGIVTIAVTTVAATLTVTAADQVQIASEFSSPKRAQ